MVWFAPNPCASTATGCGPAPSGRVSQAAQRWPADGNDAAVVLLDLIVSPFLRTLYVLYITYDVRVKRKPAKGRDDAGAVQRRRGCDAGIGDRRSRRSRR